MFSALSRGTVAPGCACLAGYHPIATNASEWHWNIVLVFILLYPIGIGIQLVSMSPSELALDEPSG